jgi:hypothetical protein
MLAHGCWIVSYVAAHGWSIVSCTLYTVKRQSACKSTCAQTPPAPTSGWCRLRRLCAVGAASGGCGGVRHAGAWIFDCFACCVPWMFHCFVHAVPGQTAISMQERLRTDPSSANLRLVPPQAVVCGWCRLWRFRAVGAASGGCGGVRHAGAWMLDCFLRSGAWMVDCFVHSVHRQTAISMQERLRTDPSSANLRLVPPQAVPCGWCRLRRFRAVGAASGGSVRLVPPLADPCGWCRLWQFRAVGAASGGSWRATDFL